MQLLCFEYAISFILIINRESFANTLIFTFHHIFVQSFVWIHFRRLYLKNVLTNITSMFSIYQKWSIIFDDVSPLQVHLPFGHQAQVQVQVQIEDL